MNVDMMIRCIGRVNYPVLREFQERLVEMTRAAHKVRMTTPAGEDVEFENDPLHPVNCELGYADTPGSHMMAGQVAWSPKLDSINGVIVFDGSVVPPVGLLREPIRLVVEKGEIVKIEGGKEAMEFETWLRSFHHPQMFQMAHVCYGFNPGAKLTGHILEDERVWGCTEWGVGNIGAILIPPDGIPGPSHSDGICLNTSVWLDGKLIIDQRQVVDKKLQELAHQLGKA
ncbi:MAG: aminopeptidase [Candidatus Caldatribacteriaceae bacterium]